MIQDPLTVWEGTYPYDALAPVGITPESSHADVEQAAFTLMTRHMMNTTRHKAWQELRELPRRLLADFLLYDVDPATDIGRARDRVRRRLADPGEPPEVSAALTMPAEILHGLADELAEMELEPPPPPEVPAELCPFPSQELIDRLIHFDR